MLGKSIIAIQCDVRTEKKEGRPDYTRKLKKKLTECQCLHIQSVAIQAREQINTLERLGIVRAPRTGHADHENGTPIVVSIQHSR
jgi:hypothetical protein